MTRLKKLLFDLTGDSEKGDFWLAKEGINFRIPAKTLSMMTKPLEKLTIFFATNPKESRSGSRRLDGFRVSSRILGSEAKKCSIELKIKLLNEEELSKKLALHQAKFL